jgi:hypothetical protein
LPTVAPYKGIPAKPQPRSMAQRQRPAMGS